MKNDDNNGITSVKKEISFDFENITLNFEPLVSLIDFSLV